MGYLSGLNVPGGTVVLRASVAITRPCTTYEVMSTEPHKSTLALKLANILGEVGKVPKSGRNTFHNYDYVTENDLVYAVRDKLSAAGIFVFTSVEGQHIEVFKDEVTGKQSVLTTVTTRHTFIESETGEQFSVLSQGQGSDVGDKGGYKAITGAMKYFLYKCFMIPTGDDPEADEGTDKRSAAGSGSPQSRAPAQTRQSNPPPSVPRDADVGLEDKYRDGAWEKVVIHFGTTYKGQALGQLSDSALSGWFKWTPQPYKGKINQQDMELRAALNVAAEEVEQGSAN